MRSSKDKKLESKCRVFSTRICHESTSWSNINNIPFIEWKVSIMFEIFIYLQWERFCIGYLFCIVVHILKSRNISIVVQWSRFSILGAYFLYSKSISFVDSSHLSKCEISNFFFSSKYHHKFLGSHSYFFEVCNYFCFFWATCLSRVGSWTSWSRKKKGTSFYFFWRKMSSRYDLFSKFRRSMRFIYIYNVSYGISMHAKFVCNISYTHWIMNLALNNTYSGNNNFSIWVICFVTHDIFG